MDAAINDYRARREKRLAERGIYPEKISKIIAFAQRRAARLDARGYRADAEEDDKDNNQNEGGGSSGGAHGNTRLPFGLCMRFGIDIDPSWGPREAWDALADKGITPSGAYERLRKGEDPGTADTPEPPKEPVKKFSSEDYGGAEYDSLRSWKSSVGRKTVWRLIGSRVEGTGDGSYAPAYLTEAFSTKEDLIRYLKEKGVEEFADPETGEIINPKEMETPTPLFTRGKTGYSAVTIGLKDGRYTIYATDMAGKKQAIKDYGSLKEAQEYLAAYKVDPDAIKLSPAIKKREKERLEWLSSDKKLYFEDGGVKYGDPKIEKDWRGYYLSGEAEDGSKFSKKFETKADAMAFLKDQGVERVKFEKETLNPQEFEMPATKAVIGGRAYQDLELTIGSYGEVQLSGTDLDGEKRGIAQRRYGETLGAFRERISQDYGVGEDKLTISDETRQRMAEIEKEEEEKERRRKEFESKAIEWPTGRKYADVELMKDGDGVYSFYGYTRDGDKRRIAYGEDFYSAEKYAEQTGHDISEFIKDDDVRKAYDRYKDSMKDFEAKASDFAGDKYADIQIIYEGGMYKVRGINPRGRTKEIARESSYEDLEKVMNQYGYSPTQFPMDDEATRRKERAMKAKYALATGRYYALGKKDDAFKDIRVQQDPSGEWYIIGTDVDGNEKQVEIVKTWDDAVSKMSKYGVSDYKLKDKSGAEMGKPTYGMHGVMLMKKPGGGFVVYADTDRFGTHEIMYETPNEAEARKWLKDNNVPESGIKTRGMNPNDDVPRTHTMISLDNFDTHRMEKAEEFGILRDMDEPTKQETAEMLTEMFDKGAYRMNREDHFTEIVDGGFKNLLETGTSGGSSYKPGRRDTGVKTFGHDYDIEASEAERYGYWGVEDDAEAFDRSTAGGYGSIQFKFKKDKVGERTTYTFGDTLDAGRPLAGYAGRKPTIEGVSGLDEYGTGDVKLEEIREEYRKYKQGKISFNDFHRFVSRKCQDGYVECQYHGKLGIEDVDTIVFPKYLLDKTFKNMSDSERKRVLTKLKSSGVILTYEDGGRLKDGYERLKEQYGEV